MYRFIRHSITHLPLLTSAGKYKPFYGKANYCLSSESSVRLFSTGNHWQNHNYQRNHHRNQYGGKIPACILSGTGLVFLNKSSVDESEDDKLEAEDEFETENESETDEIGDVEDNTAKDAIPPSPINSEVNKSSSNLSWSVNEKIIRKYAKTQSIERQEERKDEVRALLLELTRTFTAIWNDPEEAKYGLMEQIDKEVFALVKKIAREGYVRPALKYFKCQPWPSASKIYTNLWATFITSILHMFRNAERVEKYHQKSNRWKEAFIQSLIKDTLRGFQNGDPNSFLAMSQLLLNRKLKYSSTEHTKFCVEHGLLETNDRYFGFFGFIERLANIGVKPAQNSFAKKCVRGGKYFPPKYQFSTLKLLAIDSGNRIAQLGLTRHCIKGYWY